MALFKIFRGQEEQLAGVKKHDGYAYFTSDTGNLFIDVGNEDDGGKRIQVNAKSAVNLYDGSTTIEIDDIVLKDTIAAGKLAIGKSKEEGGLTGLDGIGALFTDDQNIPTFGTIPIKYGGTGAVSIEDARTNLQVYSKTEVDQLSGTATSELIEKSLMADKWEGSDDAGYTQTISIPALRCGKNGNIPPIITFKTNKEEYSKIEKADATPKIGIAFTIKEKPQDNIELLIIDVG